MAFREVLVLEVREVLRVSLGGARLRTVAGRGVDRKTARRMWPRPGCRGEWPRPADGRGDLQVVATARPARAGGHGTARPGQAGRFSIIRSASSAMRTRHRVVESRTQ